MGDLERLVAFVYTGQRGAGGREGLAGLARHLQIKVDLGEGEGKEATPAKGVAPAFKEQEVGKERASRRESVTKTPAKGSSWSDFIAENGATPVVEATPATKKRGRPVQSPTSAPSKADAVVPEIDDDEDIKARAEKVRIGIRVKNLTKDSSRETKKYLDLEAVEEATMMETALKKNQMGKKERKSGVEEVAAPLVNGGGDHVEVVKTKVEDKGVVDKRRSRTAVPSQEVVPRKRSVEKKAEVEVKKTEKKDEVEVKKTAKKVEVEVKKTEKKGKTGTKKDEDVFEVERILDERMDKESKKEYLVKWKGWNNPEDNTWESVDSLDGSKKLIKDYEKKLEVIARKKMLAEDSDGSDGVEIIEEKSELNRPGPTSAKKKGRKSKDNAISEESVEKVVIAPKSTKKERKKKVDSEANEAPVDEYEIEKILDKREGAGGREYLVKWKGWEDEQDRTWEPQDNLKGSEKLLK